MKRMIAILLLLPILILLGACGQEANTSTTAPGLPKLLAPSIPSVQESEENLPELKLQTVPELDRVAYQISETYLKNDIMELQTARVCGGSLLEVFRQYDGNTECFSYELYWKNRQFSIPSQQRLNLQTVWASDSALWTFCLQETDGDIKPMIFKWDWNGNYLSSINSSELLREYPCDVLETEQGLLLLTETSLLCLDDKADNLVIKAQLDFEDSDSFGVLCLSGNGTIYCLRNRTLSLFNPECFSLENLYELPLTYQVWPGNENYDLFLTSAKGLYGVKLAEDRAVELLIWENANLTEPEAFCGSEESGFQILQMNPFTLKNELLMIQEIPPEQSMDKTELVIATMESEFTFVGSDTYSAIQYFNQRNDQYHISVAYYGSNVLDCAAKVQQLKMDILTGEQIDLLLLHGFDVYPFIVQGLFEDLYLWLDGDADLCRDQLSPAILTALEMEGKLYTCAKSYSVTGFAGNKALLGNQPSWSLWDFARVLQTIDMETVIPISGYTGADFLSAYIMYCYDHFVDESKGVCWFDSEEFQLLLELCRDSFPAQPKNGSIKDGTAVLEPVQTIPTFLTFGVDFSAFGENAKLIGFPGAGGNGGVVTPGYDAFSMLSTSQNKEGAWEFLKFLWEPVSQSRTNSECPALLEAMDKKLTQQVQERAVMTQEEANLTREYYINAAAHSTYYAEIQNIVNEEAQAMLAGDKSVVETARIIQNQASIYLGENE